MHNDIVKSIERKYEQKKNIAEKKYEEFKKKIYSQNPRLAEIDKEIALYGINSSKASLSKDPETREKIKEDLKIRISELKEEKSLILKSLGIENLQIYDCSKCKDTGYIMTPTGSVQCSCFKQELLNEAYSSTNMYNLKTETFDNFDSSLFSDDSNSERYGTDVTPRENIENIKDVSLAFVENFDNPKQKNLLFSGTPGSGKTFLSSCIANEVIKKGYTVLYQTSPLLFNDIFNYKFGNSGSSKEMYDYLFNVNLLIIDDLGTENLSDAKFSELFTILNSRLMKPNTKTIISTNLSLQEMSKVYDLRILSRIIGNYDIYRFFGDDIRFKNIN